MNKIVQRRKLFVQLNKGEIDAVLVSAGLQSDAVKSIKGNFKLIPLRGNSDTQNVYSPVKVEYANLNGGRSVDTLSARALFMTRVFRSEEQIKSLSDLRTCFFRELPKIQDSDGTHPAWQDVNPDERGDSRYWYELPGVKAAAVRAIGDHVNPVTLIPFSDEFKAWDPLTHKRVIPYGSTKLVEIGQKNGWEGVFYNDHFNVETWVMKHPHMLNTPVFIGDLQDVVRRLLDINPDNRYFIRPRKDLKEFAGVVTTAHEIIHYNVSTAFGNYQLHPDMEVVISDVREIFSEQRWFVVDGKIIEGRTYRRDGDLVSDVVAPDLEQMAQAFADFWLPHQNCVMDTAVTPAGLKIVEFNCINCSGTYGHDHQKIATAISEYFSKTA